MSLLYLLVVGERVQMSSSMYENDSEFLQEIGFLCLFFFFFKGKVDAVERTIIKDGGIKYLT
jgi:hypothetical protein